MLCLWVVAASAVCAGNDAPPIADRTDSTYIALAREYMGFDDAKHLASEPKSTSVEVITASETSTPFQTEKFAGQRVWHVCFEGVQLALDRTKRGDKVADPRDFHIYFDSASGDLLRIISRATDYDQRDVAKPCQLDPELCYRAHWWIEGSPPPPPTIGFLRAINGVVGVDPTDSAEIKGRFAQQGSSQTGESRPIWIANLFGLPAAIGSERDQGHAKERSTHQDCIIEVATGTCVSCGMPPVIKWDDPAKADEARKPRTNARARQYQTAAKAAEERAKEKEKSEQEKQE